MPRVNDNTANRALCVLDHLTTTAGGFFCGTFYSTLHAALSPPAFLAHLVGTERLVFVACDEFWFLCPYVQESELRKSEGCDKRVFK